MAALSCIYPSVLLSRPIISAPYWLVHRADLHVAFLDATCKGGVEVLTKKRVVAYDFNVPSATTQDGEVFTADLIIGADGIKSICRPLLIGRPDIPRDKGDIAYLILIPSETLLADPDLTHLIKDLCTTCPTSSAGCTGPAARRLAAVSLRCRLLETLSCSPSGPGGVCSWRGGLN